MKLAEFSAGFFASRTKWNYPPVRQTVWRGSKLRRAKLQMENIKLICYHKRNHKNISDHLPIGQLTSGHLNIS